MDTGAGGLLKLLSVFGFGMIGLWEGIPVGFVLGLPPVAIAVASGLGSTTATLIVMSLGERIRARLIRRRAGDGPVKRERMIDRIWKSYGLIGFALLAPCLVGGPIGVAMGLFLRAPPGRLLFWLIVGIVLWTLLLTGAGVYGSEGVRRLLTRS